MNSKTRVTATPDQIISGIVCVFQITIRRILPNIYIVSISVNGTVICNKLLSADFCYAITDWSQIVSVTAIVHS